jgi:hypothetical protein
MVVFVKGTSELGVHHREKDPEGSGEDWGEKVERV